MHLLSNKTARGVRGFTLVELLVVITIIGMLMALLIPAINNSTEAARQSQCKNNIRQLAVGLLNFQTTKQNFPGYVQPLRRSDGTFLRINTGGGLDRSTFFSTDPGLPVADQRRESQVSWAGLLLPEIDQQQIYDLMLDPTTAGDAAIVVPVEVFRCPSDTELLAIQGSAGITYSANTGNWDWDGEVTGALSDEFIQPGNAAPFGDVKFNGMFFNLTQLNRPITQTLTSVRDGAGTTILLAENVHKELETPASSFVWMGVSPTQPAEQQFGVVWTTSLQPNNLPVTDVSRFQQPFSFEADTAPPYPSTTPEYARPASNHSGGIFNVVFVDGHADSIAADVDYTVYQRLMTPQGRKAEHPGAVSTATTDAITALRQLGPPSPDDF